MLNSFLVMTGGAVGSLLRYQCGRFATHIIGTAYPWGTLAVNIVGGFVMGVLAGWLARSGGATLMGGEQTRLLLGVGVLGGFTTFSSFSLETWLMVERGQGLMALSYVLVSVIGAVGALAIGLLLARSVIA